MKYIADRRDHPREDLLTELAQARYPDATVPDIADVACVATFLFASGLSTTGDVITSALLMLGSDQELQETLRGDPSQLPSFLEEVLRFEPPVKGNFRLARKATSIGDLPVDVGSHIFILIASANRDDRIFKNPEVFLPKRNNASDHLSFGRGIHSCPGAALARAESRIAVEELLKRTHRFRLSSSPNAAGTELQWEPSFFLRRLRALQLEFDWI